MGIKIALAGNPNSGKTTLFNVLTGSNQFVGNWPGVTIEKKEGSVKGYPDVTLVDLPGIYSLSPYTTEEVVARNFLVNERPDAILNIVDGTNLERNLYLTTQLKELGIPVVVAINMMDVVKKNGDTIDLIKLSKSLGCKFQEISALKETGITEAIEAAISSANEPIMTVTHHFSGAVEHALAHIEEAAIHDMPSEQQRWYAIKIFERDKRVLEKLGLDEKTVAHIENDIKIAEQECDDDAESIITNERYNYITSVVSRCCVKKNAGKLTVSDKIDRVVTGKYTALPIFAVIMFLVYFISVSTVGTWATDWANDGIFGDGWHLFGIGSAEYEENIDNYAQEHIFTDELKETVGLAQSAGIMGADALSEAISSGSYSDFSDSYDTYSETLISAGYDISSVSDIMDSDDLPQPEVYGIWVPGIPVLVTNALNSINCASWLQSLLVDGIIGGVGSVLGFVPQLFMLFLILSFLEACGYMARIAFVLDRIFRKFGLSGKSFIPMLIGVGCSVPGIMSSRTIENLSDRRMTVITTSFIPCSAKLPIIALVASAMFGGAWWVAPSAYLIGVIAVITSGVILKKTKFFVSEDSPFVMELPPYHMPTFSNLMRSVKERISSFIKKAGTIILLASVLIWLLKSFGVANGGFAFDVDMPLESSILGMIGSVLRYIFIPLGFGNTKCAVATIMGLIAKEEIVGVFGVLGFSSMTQLSAYSFLLFNLLCAPCFAAMGAIRREMNSPKWTAFAIAYQCTLAYSVSLIVYQIGSIFTGNLNVVGLILAILLIVFLLYMLFGFKKQTVKAVK